MRTHQIRSTKYNALLIQFDTLIKVKKYKTKHEGLYQKRIEEFLIFMEKNGVSTVSFNREHLTSYYDYLIQRPNKRGGTLSDSTINHHLFAIRLFFEMLLDTNQADSLPMIPKYLRGSHGRREIVTVNEIKSLYSLCTTCQERALLSVAYGCGLRRSEIESLNLQDVNLRTGILIVKSGKNSKRREVPMSDRVKLDLKAYLNEERIDQVDPRKIEHSFFINKIGTRMKGAYLNELLKKIVRRSTKYELRSKSITLHSLRHSIATHLAENGADIHFIKSFLGHSEIDTSHLYAIRRKRKYKL